MNKIIFLCLFCFGLYAQNGTILDININKEDLEIEVASFQNLSRNSQTYYGIGGLKTYDESDKAILMYSATMTQVGHTDLKGLAFGVGFKGVQSSFESNGTNYTATAIGVRVKGYYTFPLKVKTIAEVEFNYAPKSLSFSNKLNGYSEYRAMITSEPIDKAWVYAGIRGISFSFDSTTYEINKSIFVGMKIYF